MGLGSFPMLSDDDHSFTTTNSDDSLTTQYLIKHEPASDSDYESDLLDGDKSLTHQHLTFSPQYRIKPEGELCFGCGDIITERWLLKVNSRSWHVHCLRCCMCLTILDRHQTCFIKEDNIYCKLDYARQFGTKCAKCLRNIQSNDWVRRAKDNVYHLACFACDSCKRQLSTGEEFALQEDRVLCKTHYVETVEGGPNRDSDSQQRNKTKRVRTTFTEEQLQVLQANFQLDSNPDGQDLERIAQITGLSKRVTQVWFQNSRARQKKHQQQTTGGKMDGASPQSVHTDDGVDWGLLDESS